MARPLVFFWENFGPMHSDRVEAVQRQFGAERPVLGVEIYARSQTYAWLPESGVPFERLTLFPSGAKPCWLRRLVVLTAAFARIGKGAYFLCHYERLEVFLIAWWLRMSGSLVFVMGDSKFDDYKRYLWREIVKYIFFLPYHGSLASGTRSQDYQCFLGIRGDRIYNSYNAISIERWRHNAGLVAPPDITSHQHRPFVCVARLVPKKNLFMLITAYARYRTLSKWPRDLELCGSGELELPLRTEVARLGLEKHVHFHGFLQAAAVAKILSGGLALILPSIEEQFGYAVIEAQACGLPVILSENCGARDCFVRSGVNGFVVEPNNPQGLAFFMNLLCLDAALWSRMAGAAWESAENGDVARFVESVTRQLERNRSAG